MMGFRKRAVIMIIIKWNVNYTIHFYYSDLTLGHLHCMANYYILCIFEHIPGIKTAQEYFNMVHYCDVVVTCEWWRTEFQVVVVNVFFSGCATTAQIINIMYLSVTTSVLRNCITAWHMGKQRRPTIVYSHSKYMTPTSLKIMTHKKPNDEPKYLFFFVLANNRYGRGLSRSTTFRFKRWFMIVNRGNYKISRVIQDTTNSDDARNRSDKGDFLEQGHCHDRLSHHTLYLLNQSPICLPATRQRSPKGQ